MDVQRIKTEGKRIDEVRNVERLWLAVTTQSANGCVVEGHMVRPGADPTRIEVYADRLPGVLARVRTEAHRAAWAQAIKMHEIAAAQERERHGLPADADLGVLWNGCPEIHLQALGYRTGLPPLESCEVIRPDNGATMDAHAFSRLPEEQRHAWLVEAPMTPMNAAQRANEHLAATLAEALSRRDAQEPRGNNGKGQR